MRIVAKIRRTAFSFYLLLVTGSFLGASPPNIIYILADDLGYGDLSIYGQQRFSTPHIDRLASEGMVFTQHYSGSTVCAPSRSALMTGLHTGHTPVRGNFEIQPEGQYPIPADIPTMPKRLREAGYTTGAFGKWGLGFPGSEGDPTHHFDVFYGFNCQRLGHHYYPHHLWDNTEKVILEGNKGTAKGAYAPELIHRRVLEFIEENKDRPFFCFIPTIIPHAELAAPEAYMDKFRGKFGEETPWKGTDSGPEYRLGKYESQAEPRAAFAAMVTYLDDQVGEIVAKLDELGLTKNTLVIFTSDNGPHQEAGAEPDFFDSNGPFRGYKRDLYEAGIRVPMIARWPGTIEAATRTDHISAFWDVLPTALDVAGLEAPAGIDGISFLPTLSQFGQQRNHQYLYWEFHERGGRVALRMGDWKAVRYNLLNDPNAPIQLYDLTSDPWEAVDLADTYSAVVAEMKELLSQARTNSPIFTFSQTQYSGDK